MVPTGFSLFITILFCPELADCQVWKSINARLIITLLLISYSTKLWSLHGNWIRNLSQVRTLSHMTQSEVQITNFVKCSLYHTKIKHEEEVTSPCVQVIFEKLNSFNLLSGCKALYKRQTDVTVFKTKMTIFYITKLLFAMLTWSHVSEVTWLPLTAEWMKV